MSRLGATSASSARPAYLACAVLVALSVACSNRAGASGAIEIRISGESAASEGFLFPKGSDVTFRDGWQLSFSHVLVTVDDVTLSEDPDRVPSDQSQVGAVVARVAGPWAVDLAVPGPLAALGGEGTATALARLEDENQRGGAELAHDERYAFGYRVVGARAEALRVNFASDGAAEAAYERMIAAGRRCSWSAPRRSAAKAAAAATPPTISRRCRRACLSSSGSRRRRAT